LDELELAKLAQYAGAIAAALRDPELTRRGSNAPVA
jgi:hypothetical protein